MKENTSKDTDLVLAGTFSLKEKSWGGSRQVEKKYEDAS
jgi:hypothetical protein